MMWTVHIEGGPRRVNHAAVCVGDKIYSFGGYCSTEEYKDWGPIPVYVLDTKTFRWSQVKVVTSMVPFQRYGHTTVAYGHKVYMWGGRNNSVACDKLFCFDTETLTWSTPIVTGVKPLAKDGHSACIVGNKMYIFGGFEYIGDQYCQEVHSLNLDTLKWMFVNAKGTPPLHRDFHTAVAVDERMYIFGGRSDLRHENHLKQELYCPKICYLDTVTETWVTLDPSGYSPQGRRSHSAWLYKDFMYVFGGYNGDTVTHLNDLHRYSIKNNYWEQLNYGGKVPCERRRQACIVHEDRVYLFGGTSSTDNIPALMEDLPHMLIDNSDLHVLDYSVSLKTLCMLKVIKHSLDVTVLPLRLIDDILMMAVPNRISRPVDQAG